MGQPELWIIVGGNGAGKSTFYNRYIAPQGLPFVNADIIAKERYPDAPEAHSYEARDLADELRQQLLLEGKSFCFETVFSHPGKIDFIADAKRHGFKVIMVVIHVERPELNMARVDHRVKAGGHSVPEDKIRDRIPRTLRHIKMAKVLCDEVLIFDNSVLDNPFELKAHLVNNDLVKQAAGPDPQWLINILAANDTSFKE